MIGGKKWKRSQFPSVRSFGEGDSVVCFFFIWPPQRAFSRFVLTGEIHPPKRPNNLGQSKALTGTAAPLPPKAKTKSLLLSFAIHAVALCSAWLPVPSPFGRCSSCTGVHSRYFG